MAVAVGTHAYSLGTSPCTGLGLSWTANELDEAIEGSVAAVIFDDAGNANIATLLAGLAETQFEQAGIAEILRTPGGFESWRVGEAIAETYLTDHRDCTFPWPDGRDERKSGSSLPGADLVGFTTDAQGTCFAFGEVKTSSEDKHPPGATYGRTGLKQQLEDLRDSARIRTDLIRYLGHRASGADWLPRFRDAARRYVRNGADFRVYGILIRDVGPHEDDLRVRVAALNEGCPAGTGIELLSVYLPGGSIDELVAKTQAAKPEGSA
ncbi:hypothetical protein [Methylobacterium brachythecii]|uniref:Anti-bacteriophage protein A/HamA C-terminal domain-containing protein n=1 Tax=Methylobacterium brachythecii TaxID=1176177 RepID=A0A7W6AP44_9HYPH|nr:hypothetical protein [Methylobacterium brachythecii]MBB3904126.1 hypothetical protein [Methylobacterium brachythecii]GLS42868.1 hypothetical protein GCM10007884_08530 [Methylobacterium brachythecii]